MPPLSRAERLDRLPFTPLHRRLLVVAGAGWAMDAMDVGLISFIMAALAKQWQLDGGTVAWIGSVGFIGMAIGASLGGSVADRVGRRFVFAATLLVYGVATGAAAFSWSVASLLAFRFLIGFGLGAELPVASTLVSEFAPSRIRGRIVVLLEAFWAFGWILAALIGTYVIPRSENGWRWAFALGAIPALYSSVVRRALPESVRFLETKGRVDEAEQVVRRFEAQAGVASPRDAPPPEPVAAPAGVGLAELWRGGLARRTLALWMIWFGINFAYYGAFIWIPTLLTQRGFSLVKSFEYTLIITLAQLPGYAVSAYLIEKWGRRPTLAAFLAGSVGAALLFARADGRDAVLVAGCLLSFFNLGAWGAVYAATPEVYPTAVRATGAGWAAGFGRIASILAPLAVPPLMAAGGTEAVFGTFAAFFGLAIIGAALLPEWRGRQLDDAVAGAAG
ncbi:MFS transporter [Longimicrobium terrae]|uniref:Putative MFS transporter n=1 Tax=Longimicrobium terrae TaxID=1639882 RepID=A0A841H3R4_9BACT|nr:MFS transporter [Longimicrobium terrae]MBB4638340.1 putative MFS transporter [Longimicrobium terrae]MBB6072592.1 putative MFS transporter [Longimicrobium terrae]NNC28629.1 MFS transporter [Longimicrobium terrae]